MDAYFVLEISDDDDIWRATYAYSGLEGVIKAEMDKDVWSQADNWNEINY